MNFYKYYRYTEIQSYLNHLKLQYPKWVTIDNYGESYEGRELTCIYVSNNNQNRPIIFIDAGIHAREWIATAQVLYIIDQLFEKDTNYLKSVDWVLVPLLNPDGYEYTHTVDRFWRKTRSKGKKCHGVDPNRNFNHYWGGLGSSRHECSDTFAGPRPFSEPETRALSKLLHKYANRTKLYLSFHSAAQSFLHPWGYTIKTQPSNILELKNLAKDAQKAVIALNGTIYNVGTTIAVGFCSGCSRDWAYGVAGIPLAYTIELPPGGINRFDMPPGRILSVVREMFEAVKVFHKYVENKYK